MGIVADRRLYINRDKSRVVEEGDKSAAYLFAAAGRDITAADAQAYGLECEHGKVILPGGRSKAAKKGEDKALKRGGDKAGGDKRGGDKAATARPPDREKA